MLKTQLLIAIRQFWKHRTASVINVLGLSLGLTAFILILEYVSFEWSFNQQYENADGVFRLLSSNEDVGAYLPPGVGPVLEADFPSVAAASRVIPFVGHGVFSVQGPNGEQIFREDETAFVDSEFLDFFDHKMVMGSGNLDAPLTMALNQTMAQKYFGDQDPVGKQIQVDNQFGSLQYSITGVFEDQPANADVAYPFLFSVQTLAVAENRNGNNWADPSSLENSFVNIFLSLEDPSERSNLESDLNQWASKTFPEGDINFVMQPISEIHLGSELGDPLPTFGNRLFVLFLLLLAVLILAIAWVNYINLSTAQAIERAKEVGIRKVIGATRFQLIRQYFLETFILTIFGLGLALLLVNFAQPAFNRMLELPLGLSLFLKSQFSGLGLAILLAGALISGGYVAFVLTGLAPIQIVEGDFGNSRKGLLTRKALVVMQFTITIAFAVGTFVLFKQLHFLKTNNIGMDLDQRIVILGPEVKDENIVRLRQAFRDQLAGLPFVKQFSGSGGMPGKGHNWSENGVTRVNPKPDDDRKYYRMLMIDEYYPKAYGMKIMAGRAFKPEEAIKGWDANQVILNEAAIKALGFESPEAAIGEVLVRKERREEIVGVINDYNHNSLRTPIEATVFLPSRNSGYYTLEMTMSNFQDKITELERIYSKIFPGNPFEYQFLDENFARFYASEERLSQLFTWGSLLAIFISGMGLFGLITFIIKQKTKEIGIRKVLGASIGNIVFLLSKDFIRLVIIAVVIAIPIAWYVLQNWLQNFHYRISIQWWVFALVSVAALLLTLLTIGFQSIKAALANPVNALRNE